MRTKHECRLVKKMHKGFVLLLIVTAVMILEIYTTWPKDLVLNSLSPICIWYQFDPTEYTLNFKNVSCNYRENVSDISKEFFKGKKVKRVTYMNGTHENWGCTKHTERCSEGPYFDWKINKRINTPPCCRQHLSDTLRHITHELQLLNVSHFLAYGSVIGWVRYQDIIPNDGDFDLLIDGEFFHTPKFEEFLKMLARKYGHYSKTMESFKEDDKDVKMKVDVFTSYKNRNGGDLWPFDLDEEKDEIVLQIHKYHYFGKNQPYDRIFPLRKVKFRNFETFVPNDYKGYLKSQYRDYMKERTCKVRDGSICLT